MHLPLWWTEGLAEAWSSEQDTEDEMFIRNMVFGHRLPTLSSLTYDFSFTAYPLGGQLHHYLGERFGYGRVADMYDNLWKYSSFDEAFLATYGITLQELNPQWQYHLEQKYFPMYADRSPIKVDARPLLAEFLPTFKSVVYSKADAPPEILFMSPRTGYTTIYRMTFGAGDRSVESEVQGDKSEQFESLHFFSSSMDVSPAGKLVFISKYLEKDAIQIYDLEQRRIVGRYQFPDLVALSSPGWSPDGRKVVFSGLSVAGPSDLYILDFDTQEHYRITEDRYLENDPDWSPDGRHIVFSSDRTALGLEGSENLFLHDVESGATSYLTYGPWKDLDPRWSPDGKWIAFTSDRTGVHDLYLVDVEGRGGRITNYTGDSFDVDWLPDGSGLVFSAYEDGTFNIFYKALVGPGQPLVVNLVEEFGPPGPGLAHGWQTEETADPVVAEAETRDYRTKYALDFAAGQAMFAPGFGSAQGAEFLLSDMLGNHLIYFSIVTQNFGGFGDIFDSFAGQAMYLNVSRRVNWGVGVFRYNGRFVDAAYLDLYQEKTFGGFFVASYPFSKFRRLEVQTTIEHSDRLDTEEFLFVDPVNLFDDQFLTRKGIIATNALSYVKDNTLWLMTGPIDGVRWNFSAGLATDLTAARAESYSLLADARRYFRTSLRSAFALRLFGYYSDGAIPTRIAIGGPYTLRLYPFLGFVGSRIWMTNVEWRFPIMNGMALAFPFGTIRFPGIQGGLFLDMAGIGLKERPITGTWGSWGIGFRMPILFPIVLRLDVGRRFTIGNLPTFRLRGFSDTEVDFFIGFNY
jgi:WD40 repeat protein